MVEWPDGWAEGDIGTEIDGVISFDPVGLSYLLAGTGPVTLSTGDELRSDNVVSLPLSEVSSRYPGDAAGEVAHQDKFLSESRAIFGVRPAEPTD